MLHRRKQYKSNCLIYSRHSRQANPYQLTIKRMKYMIRRWIILGITMLAVLPLWAQKGMHVEALFDSRFKQDKRAVEVLIKGKELKNII